MPMVMVRVGGVRMGMGRARRLGWRMRVRVPVMGVVPVRVCMPQGRMDMLVRVPLGQV